MHKIFFSLLLLSGAVSVNAQGYFGGSFQSNTNFFIRDEKIGASDLPHYDNYKIGTEAWLNLNYVNDNYGLEIGSRLDFFYNSIIQNPTVPFTGAGLGILYIKKRLKDFTITGGYFYDQIGTGIAYRSWEERPLGIDNALLGAKVEYEYNDILKVKAFTGLQKRQFSLYKTIISGANAEANHSFNDKVSITGGVGTLNRSMDEESMGLLVKNIESLDTSQRFVPKYNTYVFTGYTTLRMGDFSLYAEGAYKTREAINGFGGSLLNKPGNVFYTSLNYSKKGIGASVSFKRTENFTLRTSPNEILFQGMLSFIPPTARQNSLRLPARYFANSLEQTELAFGGEVTYSPNKKLKFTLNGSEIRDLINQPKISEARNFFREIFVESVYKPNKKIELELGFQYVRYNREIYLGDGDTDIDAYTPFAEVNWKINKKMSLRVEAQYQHVIKDFGQWIYALAEFNIAPRWSIAVSDMWNFDPNPEISENANHYYSVFLSFTHKAHRFSINYVKQVEGIVCTGGVCRFEPAFSGVKLGINSTF